MSRLPLLPILVALLVLIAALPLPVMAVDVRLVAEPAVDTGLDMARGMYAEFQLHGWVQHYIAFAVGQLATLQLGPYTVRYDWQQDIVGVVHIHLQVLKNGQVVYDREIASFFGSMGSFDTTVKAWFYYDGSLRIEVYYSGGLAYSDLTEYPADHIDIYATPWENDGGVRIINTMQLPQPTTTEPVTTATPGPVTNAWDRQEQEQQEQAKKWEQLLLYAGAALGALGVGLLVAYSVRKRGKLPTAAILLVVLGLGALLAAPCLASTSFFKRDAKAEQLAYSLGWDKGVCIVVYQNRQYGTGFWIERGYLVTAAHVVSDNPAADYDDIIVVKGSWAARARVVAMLDSHHGDIVILETENHAMPPDAHIFPLLLLNENTTAALKGKPLYVIGYPFELVALDNYNLEVASLRPRAAEGCFAYYNPDRELIEFQAITDCGNSGGPVVTESGAVVGAVSYAQIGQAGIMYLATSSNVIIDLCRIHGIPFRLQTSIPIEDLNVTVPVNEDLALLAVAFGAGVVLTMIIAGVGRGRRGRAARTNASAAILILLLILFAIPVALLVLLKTRTQANLTTVEEAKPLVAETLSGSCYLPLELDNGTIVQVPATYSGSVNSTVTYTVALPNLWRSLTATFYGGDTYVVGADGISLASREAFTKLVNVDVGYKLSIDTVNKDVTQVGVIEVSGTFTIWGGDEFTANSSGIFKTASGLLFYDDFDSLPVNGTKWYIFLDDSGGYAEYYVQNGWLVLNSTDVSTSYGVAVQIVSVDTFPAPSILVVKTALWGTPTDQNVRARYYWCNSSAIDGYPRASYDAPNVAGNGDFGFFADSATRPLQVYFDAFTGTSINPAHVYIMYQENLGTSGCRVRIYDTNTSTWIFDKTAVSDFSWAGKIMIAATNDPAVTGATRVWLDYVAVIKSFNVTVKCPAHSVVYVYDDSGSLLASATDSDGDGVVTFDFSNQIMPIKGKIVVRLPLVEISCSGGYAIVNGTVYQLPVNVSVTGPCTLNITYIPSTSITVQWSKGFTAYLYDSLGNLVASASDADGDGSVVLDMGGPVKDLTLEVGYYGKLILSNLFSGVTAINATHGYTSSYKCDGSQITLTLNPPLSSVSRSIANNTVTVDAASIAVPCHIEWRGQNLGTQASISDPAALWSDNRVYIVSDDPRAMFLIRIDVPVVKYDAILDREDPYLVGYNASWRLTYECKNYTGSNFIAAVPVINAKLAPGTNVIRPGFTVPDDHIAYVASVQEIQRIVSADLEANYVERQAATSYPILTGAIIVNNFGDVKLNDLVLTVELVRSDGTPVYKRDYSISDVIDPSYSTVISLDSMQIPMPPPGSYQLKLTLWYDPEGTVYTLSTKTYNLVVGYTLTVLADQQAEFTVLDSSGNEVLRAQGYNAKFVLLPATYTVVARSLETGWTLNKTVAVQGDTEVFFDFPDYPAPTTTTQAKLTGRLPEGLSLYALAGLGAVLLLIMLAASLGGRRWR